MNKLTKIIFLILILLFSINVFSSDFTYGVKIGGTYSTASYYYEIEGEVHDLTDNGYYWGIFFSFYGHKNIYKMMDIQFEGNYNQRGMSTDYGATTIPALELVSLLKLNISYLVLYTGVFTALTGYKKSKYNDGSVYTDVGYPALDFGYILGVELKYNKYLIDFRYVQGFRDFLEELGSSTYHYYYNSRQFTLSFGYQF